MPDTCPGIPPDIAFITGPSILGALLNWGFMGMLVPQIYYYHTNHSTDATWLKTLVYSMATLEVLQTCLVTADAFHWFVFGYGNMARLDDTFLNSWDVPLLDAVIALIAQLFYCWRIWILRPKSYGILSAIIIVALTQCGAGIAVAIRANEIQKLSHIGENLIPQAIWLSGSALADIMITATLSWTLLMAGSKGLPERSRRIINRIVTVTVETNSLTAGVAILSLIIFLAVPAHSALVVPPTAVMGKLYTNCLVAVLNHRSQHDEPASQLTLDSHSMGMSSRTRWQSSKDTTSPRSPGKPPRLYRSASSKDEYGVNTTQSFPLSVTVMQDVETDDDYKVRTSESRTR